MNFACQLSPRQRASCRIAPRPLWSRSTKAGVCGSGDTPGLYPSGPLEDAARSLNEGGSRRPRDTAILWPPSACTSSALNEGGSRSPRDTANCAKGADRKANGEPMARRQDVNRRDRGTFMASAGVAARKQTRMGASYTRSTDVS